MGYQKQLNKTKIYRTGIFILLFLILTGTGAWKCSAEEKNGRVLFISSYSYSWDTIPLQMEGISEELEDNVTIDYEFMDTKKVNDDISRQIFYEHIKYLLSCVEPYDVLIVGDDDAFCFALDYRDELFKGIPIVFEGINDIEHAKEAAKQGDITGVIEQLSYADTIDMALRLYPNAKKLVAVVDDTATGVGERKQFHMHEAEYPELKFEELNASEYTKQEFAEKIAEYKDDTILLYLICSMDRYGNSYTGSEAASLIGTNAQIPVFRMAYPGMGNGLFGGNMVSHRDSGVIAGNMAMRILNGENPSSIKMVEKSPNFYCFDEEVMKRFGIAKEKLPEQSVCINEKLSFLERYAKQITEALVILILLLFSMVIVIIYVHLKQRERMLEVVETRNKQLEEAIYTAEHANQAKSVFLSRMSHEIRTPMNAILGITTLTKHCADDKDKVCENLNKIEMSSKLLLNIINDVLDMSAIESDKLKIDNSPFHLQEVISTLGGMYAALCKQKNIQLDVALIDVTEEYVIGDRLRLNQILNNLLSNALKFTEAGGKIELTIKQQTIEEKRVYLQFSVSDTGCGMSEDMIQRVFEPFEQESAKTAQNYGGSGLGMSIARNLTELMQGAISVQSEKGKGTTFTVSLPFERAQENLTEGNSDTAKEEAQEEAEEKEYDLTGTHVLLVDDTEFNLDVAADLLKLVGVTVDCVRNGKEALEAFEKSAPKEYDAILMDIQMPVLNGHEATREIRKLNREDAQTIPILAMTANAFTEDVTKSLEAGMNDHITKPIDTNILYSKLEKYCRKEK